MNKILLIIQREYLARVRNRAFLILTFVTPLLFIGIIAGSIFLATRGVEEKKICIIDTSGLFGNQFNDSKSIKFEFQSLSLDDAKKEVTEGNYYGVVYIPEISIENPEGITFYANNNPSLDVVGDIQSRIREKIEDIKLEQSGITREVLDDLRTNVQVTTFNIAQGGEKKSNAAISSGIAYMSSFLIYMFIFIYGAMVMRGVSEEKSSKIVEVIISSAKPFQLMLGKIIGVSMVGLTQFLLWAILISVGSSLLTPSLGPGEQEALQQISQNTPNASVALLEAQSDNKLLGALKDASNLPLLKIGLSFAIFYLGGYLLYGALFAAVGAAAGSETDSQQFMLPISLPLIISIISISVVLREPNGSVAVWLSMIPFTSPVVMMARLPFDAVPDWQLALSILLLIGGFIFTTWVAGRIYRVGILIHGAKVNYKVLAKWFFAKN